MLASCIPILQLYKENPRCPFRQHTVWNTSCIILMPTVLWGLQSEQRAEWSESNRCWSSDEVIVWCEWLQDAHSERRVCWYQLEGRSAVGFSDVDNIADDVTILLFSRRWIPREDCRARWRSRSHKVLRVSTGNYTVNELREEKELDKCTFKCDYRSSSRSIRISHIFHV